MSQLISPHSVSPISTKNGRLTLSTNPSVVTKPVLSPGFYEGPFQLERLNNGLLHVRLRASNHIRFAYAR